MAKFRIGDKVEACTSGGGWQKGEIVNIDICCFRTSPDVDIYEVDMPDYSPFGGWFVSEKLRLLSDW